MAAQQEPDEVVERTRRTHVAVAIASREARQLHGGWSEANIRGVDMHAKRERVGREGDPRQVQRAARVYTVRAADIEVRLARMHGEIRGDETAESAHDRDGHRARERGEVQAS